jgi:chemotaxis protein methyltransferase CheR
MKILHNIARKLQSPDEETRRLAIEELYSSSDSEALKLFYLALGDESWRVRKSAAKALTAFPDTEEAVSVLIDALYDGENVGRRTEAVDALVSLDRKALAGVIQAMNTADSDVRKFLVDILGYIKAPQSLEILLNSVNDAEDNVRLAAIEALGNLGGDQVYQKLLGLLHHSDMTTVFSSLHALGRMGREIPLPLVQKLLDRKILHRALFEVLGESKNQDAVRILATGLLDASRSARQAALRSLFKIYQRPLAQDNLKHVVEHEVCRSLEGRSLQEIGEFLQSDHMEIKRSAARILGLLRNSEALGYLLGVLEDDTVQGEVIQSLSRIRAQKPDWFKKELAQKDREVQLRLAALIEEMTPPARAAPRIMEMSTAQFELLRDTIADYGGIYFDKELKYLLERRIAHRLKALNYRNFSEYVRYLQRPETAKDELERITGELATKETYFFREEFQLRAFREEIVPELLERKEMHGEARLRIWSAGCATGEEPYTLAMILKEMNLSPRWKVEIYASDISATALQTAGTGIYSTSSFRVMGDYYLRKYFTKLNGKHQISKAIQEMVRLDKLNLLECRKVSYLQNLDVIFCRNVIIYFHPKMRRKLVENFWHLLREGGYLLLGHSESLMNLSTAFQLRHLKHDLVYQKPEVGSKA